MTPEESVQATADHLRALSYERYGDKTWSKTALLNEYFRRAARWAEAYRCDTRMPFFDIAQCVDPGVRAELSVIDRLVRDVRRPGRNSITEVAPFILHWAALRASPDFALPEGLEDPFEPLIKVFERGGGFHIDNGDINLEYISAPMRLWRKSIDRAPMTDFSTEALDEIDRAGAIDQFGYALGPDGEPIKDESE